MRRASRRGWDVLQEGLSLEGQVQLVRDAIYTRNDGHPYNAGTRWAPIDVQADSVIVRMGQLLYRVPYTIADDLAVSFGEAVRVETTFAPVALAEAVDVDAALLEAESGTPRGLVWEVVIIKPGLSANRVLYPPKALAKAAQLFESCHVYYFPDSSNGHKKPGEEKPQAALVGWMDSVRLRESDGAIVGRMNLLQEGGAVSLRAKLTDAWDRGNRKLMGLSIDCRGTTKPHTHGGLQVRLCESIDVVFSVDVVHRAAAGGELTALAESAGAHTGSTNEMKTIRDRLMAVLGKRAGGVPGVTMATATVAELTGAATKEELQEAVTSYTGDDAEPAAGAGAAAATTTPSKAELVESRLLLRERLQESKLPDAVQERIRGELRDQVLTEAEIDQAIADERAYLAKVAPTRFAGAGPAAGNGQISVGPTRQERLQAAFDRTLGLEIANPDLRTVSPLGLRDLYKEVTLGHDPRVDMRLSEAAAREMLQEGFTTATLPDILGNSLNRMLAAAYAKRPRTWKRIATKRPGGAKDFRPQRFHRIGGFGDLPVLNTQDANFVYPDLGVVDEEESLYSVSKRGGRVVVTQETIINDDMGVFARMPAMLADSAGRTLDNFAWNLLKSNPVMAYDGVTLFHADHGNLLAVELSEDGVVEMDAALFAQEELTSQEKLGGEVALLAVPHQLRPTAHRLNQSGVANNDNVVRGRFGPSHEQIVVPTQLTDANDWYGFAGDLDINPVIEISFLNDQEDPEFFLADNPLVGSAYMSDRWEYKIRHVYGGNVVDHRRVAKSVVPAL